MKKENVKINGINKSQSPLDLVVKASNYLFLSSQLKVDLKTNKILRDLVCKLILKKL